MILQDQAGFGTESCQLPFISGVHFYLCQIRNAVGKIIVIYLMLLIFILSRFFFFENFLVYLYFMQTYESEHLLTAFSQVILILIWRIEEVKEAVCFILGEWEKKLLSLNTCNVIFLDRSSCEISGCHFTTGVSTSRAITGLLSKGFLLLYIPLSHRLSPLLRFSMKDGFAS